MTLTALTEATTAMRTYLKDVFGCIYERIKALQSASDSLDSRITDVEAALSANAPSEEFIALAEAAAPRYITYNRETGYFELNGLTDLTAHEMELILRFGGFDTFAHSQTTSTHSISTSAIPQIRTTLPSVAESGLTYPFSTTGAWQNPLLESARFGNGSQYAEVSFKVNASMYILSKSLKALLDRITPTADVTIGYANTTADTSTTSAIETIYVYKLANNLNMPRCPNLSLESIEYMVANAANTKPITITLHADAFARLTEELIAEAAEKQITFATA